MSDAKTKKPAKRVVSVSLLSGEPTDGSGRICVHFFVLDEAGKFTEPSVMRTTERGVEIKPGRGRLACDPDKNPATRKVGNVFYVTHRTTAAGAVNCPKCLKTPEHVRATEELKKLEES